MQGGSRLSSAAISCGEYLRQGRKAVLAKKTAEDRFSLEEAIAAVAEHHTDFVLVVGSTSDLDGWINYQPTLLTAFARTNHDIVHRSMVASIYL